MPRDPAFRGRGYACRVRSGANSLPVPGTGYLLVLACALLLGAGWLRRRLLLVTVQGRSMEPTLAEGDRVLVRRRLPARIRRSDVVVLRRPPGAVVVDVAGAAELLVKRVVALGGDPVAADRFPRMAAHTA